MNPESSYRHDIRFQDDFNLFARKYYPRGINSARQCCRPGVVPLNSVGQPLTKINQDFSLFMYLWASQYFYLNSSKVWLVYFIKWWKIRDGFGVDRQLNSRCHQLPAVDVEIIVERFKSFTMNVTSVVTFSPNLTIDKGISRYVSLRCVTIIWQRVRLHVGK